LLLRHCETHSLEQTGCKLVMSEVHMSSKEKLSLILAPRGEGRMLNCPP
jgi:hypothetical protein